MKTSELINELIGIISDSETDYELIVGEDSKPTIKIESGVVKITEAIKND